MFIIEQWFTKTEHLFSTDSEYRTTGFLTKVLQLASAVNLLDFGIDLYFDPVLLQNAGKYIYFQNAM